MIRALRDEVIIKPFEVDRSPGGLFLVRNVKENTRGIVVAIGRDYKDKVLKVGDTILYTRNEGKRLKINGELHICLIPRWMEAIVEE
jgi:co-chaperonin GroES (HSP10)